MTDVDFRSANAVRIGTVGNGTVALPLPAGAQAGDLALMGYIANSTTGDPGGQGVITDPAGITDWTQLSAQQTLASAIGKGWGKILTADDITAGTVTCDYGTSTGNNKSTAIIACYSGADPDDPFEVLGSPLDSSSASASHVMPSGDSTGDGSCMVVSLYLGREATASTGFTPSSGWTMRLASTGTAGGTGGNAQAAIIDSGTAQAEGTNGGGTITGSQAAQYNFGWTIAIKAQAAVATARPVTDITTTGWTPSTTLGDGVAMCSLAADTDDSTYIESLAAPTASVFEDKLPAMSAAPNTVTNRVLFAGGAVSGSVKTELRQGSGTSIASRTDTYSSDPPTTATDLVLTLNGTQQAAITDLTDLRIRTTVTAA